MPSTPRSDRVRRFRYLSITAAALCAAPTTLRDRRRGSKGRPPRKPHDMPHPPAAPPPRYKSASLLSSEESQPYKALNAGGLSRPLTPPVAAHYPPIYVPITTCRPPANPRVSTVSPTPGQPEAPPPVLLKWIPAIMAIDLLDPRLTRLSTSDAPGLLSGASVTKNAPFTTPTTPPSATTPASPRPGGHGHRRTYRDHRRQRRRGKFHPSAETVRGLSEPVHRDLEPDPGQQARLSASRTEPGVDLRMLHGSDWPLQFFPLVWAGWHVGSAPLAELRYAAALDNPLDRDIALKSALGVPAAVFARTATILRLVPPVHDQR